MYQYESHPQDVCIDPVLHLATLIMTNLICSSLCLLLSDGSCSAPMRMCLAKYYYRNVTVLRFCSRVVQSMDGLLMTSPTSYEPESTAALKAWYAESGRSAYVCGPLLPSASKASAEVNEIKQSAQGAEIQAFLDSTLRTSGDKSLLYVSFRVFLCPIRCPWTN